MRQRNRGILIDIYEKNLDPTKNYNSLDKLGRLVENKSKQTKDDLKVHDSSNDDQPLVKEEIIENLESTTLQSEKSEVVSISVDKVVDKTKANSTTKKTKNKKQPVVQSLDK